MTSTAAPELPELPPFHLQPVLEELYHSRDLLDLSAPIAGPSSPPPPPTTATSPAPASTSLFSSATSIAAAAGRRAAAVASGAASPASASSAQFRTTVLPEASGSQDREVRCVEGYGNNLYIGGSDGVVEWWVCDGGSSPQGDGWTMRHKHAVFPRRPISKIILLPKVSRMFLLSDGTLHPLALPNLEVLPSTVIAPMRGVLSVILDDEELEWNGPGTDERGAEMTMVLVRRKGLGIYKLGARMVNVKEIPLPAAPTHHALFSTFLCAAIPSNGAVNYSLIDLSDASMTEVLPVSQTAEDESPNIVVIPGEHEFLVTSYTGASTMGVFLNGQGDPVRGTVEWEEHPVSIAIESGYIIALLRNHTVVIHALADLDKPAQTISLDPSIQPIVLSYSPYGVSVRDIIRDERMRTTSILLLGGMLAPPEAVAPPKLQPTDSNTSIDKDLPSIAGLDTMDGTSSAVVSPEGEEPPSGSGLTPPSSPPSFKRQPIPPSRSSSLLKSTAPPTAKGPFSTTIAETLVVGSNSVLSLTPTPVILRLEKLCNEGKMDEAIAMVDEERRKGRRGEVDSDKATHHATMRLLHLFLGFHLFGHAMFERAGDYLLRGKSDPRLLVRAFPRLRGKVIGSAEEIEVFEGLKGVLEVMPCIDDIIAAAIKRNFTPPDGPTTDEESLDTTEIGEAMLDHAKAMLTDVLRKTRQSRRKGGGGRGIDSRKIDIVIDTTLSKLLAEAGTISELFALLAAPNDAVLSELEPFLAQRPYVLATVMRQQGRIDRVLELLQEVAENPAGDPLCADPVDEVASQLESVSDPLVLRKYALWLVARDPEKGLDILIAKTSSSGGVKLEDGPLIEDLRNIDEGAANRYLEHIVVGKKSPDRTLHEDLLERLFVAAEKQVRDEGVKYHLEELEAEYRLSPDPEPFCVFFADVAPPSPIKTLRLKLMLFLQGSPFFDLEKAVTRLQDIGGLKFELAIVLGRLGKNRRALQLLARDIGDSVSAQTYCTHGGELIPPRMAHRVASRVEELVGWAALTEIGRKKKDLGHPSAVSADVQEGLVMELLGVYMRDGETASLLNAQSVHLDVLQVLDLVPNEWELDVVSSFLQRSLRRQIHERATWQILKAISAGQNLQTSEEYLEKLSHIPPMVVDGPSPGKSLMGAPNEGSIAATEKDEYVLEKADEVPVGEKGETKEPQLDQEERGFFSLEAVNKELREIRADERGRGRGGGRKPTRS